MLLSSTVVLCKEAAAPSTGKEKQQKKQKKFELVGTEMRLKYFSNCAAIHAAHLACIHLLA